MEERLFDCRIDLECLKHSSLVPAVVFFGPRGIATEAISSFLLLEQTRPLYGSVAKHNAASIRVLQKCGFVSDDPSSENDGATHILLELDAKL